ncbi:MAG: peptidylprolyl isomerase [Acidobacteriota bacterium]
MLVWQRFDCEGVEFVTTAIARIGLLGSIFSLLAFGISCKRGPTVGPDTAALVNQKEIKLSDVEKVYQNRVRTAEQTPSPEESALLRLNILTQLVSDEILMQRAATDNLTASDVEVNTRFTEFKRDYTEEKFQDFLKEQGVTVEDVKREILKNATIEKLYNKEITSKITVSDAEINEYFAKNQANYDLPESWHVLHILVTPFADSQITNARGDDAKTPEAAREKVVTLLRRVQGGEDFAVLARDYSEDSSSAQNGGDLRFLSAANMEAIDPRFRQAVQNLRVGETFPSPVVSKYGFHLVKLIEKETGGQHDLTDPKVQADVRQIVFGRKENLLKSAFLEVARSESIVRNVLAEKILTDMGSPPSSSASK